MTPQSGPNQEIAELEKQIHNLQVLADQHGLSVSSEIRRLEEDDLGIPHPQRVAPRPAGKASEGKPGTRKLKYGKTGRTRFGSGRR